MDYREGTIAKGLLLRAYYQWTLAKGLFIKELLQRDYY